MSELPNDPMPPGLVHTSDATPGIRRRRRGAGFAYRDASGRALTPEERARVTALAVPPAWRKVWISGDGKGHLQATGFDEAGRKQYIYHPDWSVWRSAEKFAGLPLFGRGLARFRARVLRDLAGEAGDLDFSVAAIAALLDQVHLRIGSPTYAATNRSYGATTLLNRHLKLGEGKLHLRYRAKGGKIVEHQLENALLHAALEAIGDLPGKNLFTYLGAGGEPQSVSSQHVNQYLASRTGVPGATAKTFRTWAGTLAAFTVARKAHGHLSVKSMAEAAALRLQNTPAISRSAYIHPSVLDLAALDEKERTDLLSAVRLGGPLRLRRDERRLLGFLDIKSGGAN